MLTVAACIGILSVIVFVAMLIAAAVIPDEDWI